MPGIRYARDPLKCQATTETIRNMCAYISSDERIARHVGVPVAHVTRYRRNLSCSQDCNKEATPYAGRLLDDPTEPSGNGEQRKWAKRAVDANALFVAALGRVL